MRKDNEDAKKDIRGVRLHKNAQKGKRTYDNPHKDTHKGTRSHNGAQRGI